MTTSAIYSNFIFGTEPFTTILLHSNHLLLCEHIVESAFSRDQMIAAYYPALTVESAFSRGQMIAAYYPAQTGQYHEGMK